VTRYQLVIYGPKSREAALRAVNAAPVGTRVEIKAEKRTNDQNALMWVLLTKLALALPWGGAKQTPDTWKLLFLDALRRELSQQPGMLPSIDGSGAVVNVGTSSSDLSKEEMTLLIELILRFGDQHDISFDDERRAAA
jgi:hypothetical protein